MINRQVNSEHVKHEFEMVDRTFNYYKLVFHSMNPMSYKNDVQKCDAWLSEMVYTTEW